MAIPRIGLSVLAVAMGLVVGCGTDNPLNRQPVRGAVTLDGQPAVRGSIEFMPVNRQGTMSGGMIQNGRYEVATENGMAPGKYAIVLHLPDPNWDRKREPEPKEMAPLEYCRDGKHVVTVVQGQENVFDFDVKSK